MVSFELSCEHTLLTSIDAIRRRGEFEFEPVLLGNVNQGPNADAPPDDEPEYFFHQ